MERPLPGDVLDQVRIRGQYEQIPTDTGRLARELSVSRDVNQLVEDFDNQRTPLRDVGRMTDAQRTAILEAYYDGTIHEKAADYPKVLSVPVENLHQRVVSGPRDQPVGHNFFVNATGFLDAGLPWATQLDNQLLNRTGTSIKDIAISSDMAGKDQLLAEITENPDPEFTTALAVYLAGRSLEGEKYLEQLYGETLKHAKGQAYTTIQSIGVTTGLRIDMLERAAGQLQRATFGSFDHLAGLVTSGNTGATGDYLIGSLRVEMQFKGKVASSSLHSVSEAHPVLVHELHHAGSAQTRDKYRCGLQINGEGLESNEGMTEYLAQLSTGSPGIERLEDGSLYVREGVSYRAPVLAMTTLHERFKMGRNTHFAVLFNAYQGDVRNQAQLEEALDEFYRLDATISGLMRG